MTHLESEFRSIVQKTDEQLWDVYSLSTGLPASSSVRLRFPKYRPREGCENLGRVRVSEQEARFLMTSQLAQSSLVYTVETPTAQTYRFTDKGVGCILAEDSPEARRKISAQTDVSVLNPNGEPLWNIEFKAHGISSTRKLRTSIQKDFEKLLCERVNGFWFHTLEAVDKNTLPLLWRVFADDLKTIALCLKKRGVTIADKELVFHVCVLRQRFSLEVRFNVKSADVDEKWLLPALDKCEVQGRQVFIEPSSGWTLYQAVTKP